MKKNAKTKPCSSVEEAIRQCGCSPEVFFRQAAKLSGVSGFDSRAAAEALIQSQRHGATGGNYTLPKEIREFAETALAQPSVLRSVKQWERSERAA